MDKQLTMMKSLTDANGISGFEYDVKKIMEGYLEPVSDELVSDNLGGLFGMRKAREGSRTLLIGGHLDEIGFMVTQIDDNGFLKFTPVGGWWNQVMLSQRMNITTDKGVLTGVIGSKPPHVLSAEARKKPVEIKDMFIDIGVASKEEAVEAGVKPGDQVTPHCDFTEMTNKNYLMAKAWDNRFGCALAIEVLQNIKEEDVNINLASGATVQEEVGLRGAKVAANKIKPDLAIAVDVGISWDTPGMSEKDGVGKMGDGPLVLLLDGSNIGHVGFRRHIEKVAEEKDIPIQWSAITGGGTDSGAFHVSNEGVPSVSIGVPLRYMHSNISVLNREDYNNAVNLVTEIVRSLDDSKVEEIIW
ncbi:M42 family metallopeptidase [Salinicoccus albus]|uniref:M42 family metallopeptidase n=1 Tax=Salinicoccus albus TaxID=418756 RepID=UPI00036F974A|nr:M42 family metallopeptidase [Salinicoccus albus]